MLLWPDGSCMLLVLEEGPGCGILLQLLRMELVSPEAAWAGDASRQSREGRKAVLRAPKRAISMRELSCGLRGCGDAPSQFETLLPARRVPLRAD